MPGVGQLSPENTLLLFMVHLCLSIYMLMGSSPLLKPWLLALELECSRGIVLYVRLQVPFGAFIIHLHLILIRAIRNLESVT